MSKTKVLVVSHFFPPESMGGAHRWQRLIRELDDDVACRVICPPPTFPYGEFERSSKLIERQEIDGVPVTRLWSYQPQEDSRAHESNIGRILNYVIFSLVSTLYTLVNFWRYDCIVTVSAPHTTFLPGIVGRMLGLRWVVDIFDLWLDNAVDFGYVDVDSIAYRYVEFLEQWAITRSDRVTVITPTMAESFSNKYDVPLSEFTIIPFGVDSNLFEPSVGEQNTKQVVYTGNLGDAHALVPFFKSFRHLNDEYKLHIVGTGKRRDELERVRSELGLEDQITFAGVVDRTEIPQILSDAAVSMVPLKRDYQLDYARPNKLLESMAVGTPYVASGVAEIETVTSESNGGIAVDNDPEEIAKAFRTLLDESELRHEMGSNGAQYIDEHHRWPILADRAESAISARGHE